MNSLKTSLAEVTEKTSSELIIDRALIIATQIVGKDPDLELDSSSLKLLQQTEQYDVANVVGQLVPDLTVRQINKIRTDECVARAMFEEVSPVEYLPPEKRGPAAPTA